MKLVSISLNALKELSWEAVLGYHFVQKVSKHLCFTSSSDGGRKSRLLEIKGSPGPFLLDGIFSAANIQVAGS